MTDRELLQKIVKAHDQWAKDREESFQEVPSYDPTITDDQPCSDRDMDDWDERDNSYAFDARDTFINLAEEARKHLEMETP